MFEKCRWALINIYFIAFDTWISLPLNPWYQKNSKIEHCKMDFCGLLLFQKMSYLRVNTPIVSFKGSNC